MSLDRGTLKFSGRWVPSVMQNLPELFLDGRLMDIPSNSIMYFFIVFRIWWVGWQNFLGVRKKRSALFAFNRRNCWRTPGGKLWSCLKSSVTTYRSFQNFRGEYISWWQRYLTRVILFSAKSECGKRDSFNGNNDDTRCWYNDKQKKVNGPLLSSD